jgi:hypothetical protein
MYKCLHVSKWFLYAHRPRLRRVVTASRQVPISVLSECGILPKGGSDHIPIIPFIRWDEKAGLRRDAIRSQRLTRSRRNGKETGYEED